MSCHGREPAETIVEQPLDFTRHTYPFDSEIDALKNVMNDLESETDKAFTEWNKLANRLHKAREALKKLP